MRTKHSNDENILSLVHLSDARLSAADEEDAKFLVMVADKQINIFLSSSFHVQVFYHLSKKILQAYHHDLNNYITPLRAINCAELLFLGGLLNTTLKITTTGMVQGFPVLEQYLKVM